jgi:hypothetical protein
MKRIVIAAACSLAVAACASNEMALQRAAAEQIGNNTSPSDIQVSDVQRGMMNVSWTATAPDGKYECSADDMVRRPLCTKAE